MHCQKLQNVRLEKKDNNKQNKIKIIKDELKISDNLSEEFGSITLWKLRNKLCNK